MWVKICANTNLADAHLAAELGADAVGFVFAPSPRQVTARQVAAITPRLPGSVLTAGVFGPAQADSLLQTVQETGLRAVQLHMPYDATFVHKLTEAFQGRVELWQVVSYELGAEEGSGLGAGMGANDRAELDVALDSDMRAEHDSDRDSELGSDKGATRSAPTGDDPDRAFASRLGAALRDPGISAVLLDAARAGASGGLGLSLPWGRIAAGLHPARLSAERAGQAAGLEPPRLLLAGGLNPGNVGEAIRTLAPDGVDVASGVEQEPGRKSPEKLRAFLHAAKA